MLRMVIATIHFLDNSIKFLPNVPLLPIIYSLLFLHGFPHLINSPLLLVKLSLYDHSLFVKVALHLLDKALPFRVAGSSLPVFILNRSSHYNKARE